LAQLIAFWFVGFICVLSTFVYMSQWRSERKLMKLLGYVVDNQSKQGGVTLWFEEESYDFPDIPEDVAYGPGTLFDCTVTLTKVNSTGVDYVLKSKDGDTLFSTY